VKAVEAEKTNTGAFGPLQIAIVLLTMATAFIHFSLLFPDVLFILNGLGYLALLAAYFLPALRSYRSQVRWAFIGYAAITILAWLFMGEKSWPAGAMGYITKVIEVILIILLWQDRRR